MFRNSKFWVCHAITLVGVFMAGCSNAQPTATFTPIPSSTPLPTWTVSPTATLPALPQSIFEPFPEEFHETTVKMAFGMLSSGTTVDEQLLIDSSIGTITIRVFWRGGDLDISLAQPDGSLIDSSIVESARYISFISDATSQQYQIGYPQKGLWTVKISSKAASVTSTKYMLEAFADAVTIISVDSDKEYYSSGDPITLMASMEDSIADNPMGPEYIHEVTWHVIVENPEGTRYSFGLYDDGRHGDGGVDNGVYANTFKNTSLPGQYNFYIQISGANNREYINGDEGKHFTRVYFRSIVVH